MTTTELVVRVESGDVPRKQLPAYANEADHRIAKLEREKAQLQYQLRLALQQLAQRN